MRKVRTPPSEKRPMSKVTEITIDGRVIVKKNSRQARTNRKTGGRYTAPSAAFERFEADALRQMEKKNLLGLNLVPPYRISYWFGMKGLLDSDLDNMIVSINDILQAARIIRDDKQIVAFGPSGKCAGGEKFETIIKIESGL